LKEEKDSGRHGVIKALNVVTEFLLRFEDTHDHRLPFTYLLDALLSLDEGLVQPLLKQARRPRGGRSPVPPGIESCQGLAAATVQRLVDTGLNQKEAREKVAKVCRDAGIKPGRKGVDDSPGQDPETTGRTVYGWCKKIKADVGRRSVAAQTFDLIRQSDRNLAQAIKSDGMEAVHRRLLEELRLSLIELRAPEHKNPPNPQC
jgi:hypothetical protein